MIAEEAAFWRDFDAVAAPSDADLRRWSLAARSIRSHYQEAAPPSALAAFVTQQIDAFRNYEDELLLLADGKRAVGNAPLADGDRSLQEADTTLANGNAACADA